MKIQTYHSQAFAKFLTKLAAMPDGDGSMLDHSILLYGSNMSNSNAHDEFPLPTLVVGGGCGQAQGRPAPEVSGPDAAGEPAADAARSRRRAGGEGRQQHAGVLGDLRHLRPCRVTADPQCGIGEVVQRACA